MEIGALNPNWRGGRGKAHGYMLVYMPEHPKADKTTKRVYEHIVIAEVALGRFLRDDERVHHFNGDGLDNTRGNLILCEDQGYHYLLELRTRALKECGDVHWRKCYFCRQYDSLENLTISKRMIYHKKCAAKYVSQRKEIKNGRTNEKLAQEESR